MKNLFNLNEVNETISRIEKLSNTSQPNWGEMNVAQMLAHLNVGYEMVHTTKYAKAKGFKKFMLTLFVKKIVCGEKPFKKNSRTAPDFLISDERDFENEKTKLIDFIKKTQELGGEYFDNKESNSFGKLTINEWNNMFFKHLDHHLTQFEV